MASVGKYDVIVKNETGIFFDKSKYFTAKSTNLIFLDFAGTQIRTSSKERECLRAKL